MTDLIKHIRGIHYFLVITCAALGYLGIIAGKENSAIVSEVNGLERYIRELNFDAGGNSIPGLDIVDLTYCDLYRDELVVELNQIRGHSGSEITGGNAAIRTAYLPVKHEIDSSLHLKPLNDVISFISEYEIGCYVLDAPRYTEDVEWLSSDDGTVQLVDVKIDWSNKHTPVVTFTGRLWFRGSDSSSSIDKDFTVRYSSRQDTLRSSIDYFDNNFKLLRKNLTNLGYFSLQEIKEIGKTRMGNDIENSTPNNSPLNILGVKVEGQHVGYLGLIIIVLTLTYLFIYISELSKRYPNSESGLEAFLWIGLIDTRLSRFLLLVSLAILPATSAALIYYKFILSSVGAMFIWCVLLFVGLRLYDMVRSISS